MLPFALVATGTIFSAISANKRNRSKYGSRQVVPSGQTTRSPWSSIDCIMARSLNRSLVSLIVGIGEITSEKLLKL
ncbi:hypothetical protein LUZ60_013423 [Juncus effusus]|nr:hypothetical protein LUZ60_013423 [Juncus effusus]